LELPIIAGQAYLILAEQLPLEGDGEARQVLEGYR
jgi:hypothetical protein